jgi:anti-sigma factor RsiW
MILTCKQLVRRVTDWREGRLSALDRAGFKLHLVRCSHCRTYVAQMDAVVEALHGAEPDAPAPAELHAALAKAFRERPR